MLTSVFTGRIQHQLDNIKNNNNMRTPIQKLFMIIEQSAVDSRGSAENLIDELLSIKQEMLEKERDLIKEAFYAGGQTSIYSQWEKEADEYIELIKNQ